MNKYKIGIYEKAFPENLSIEQMLLLAKKHGYDYFELSIDRTDFRISRLTSDDFLSELQKAIENSGVKILSICLSAISTYTLGHPNENIRNRGFEIFCNALDFAERLNVRIIQIPACDVPKDEKQTSQTDNIYREMLKKMVSLSASYGIILGLENMETEYMGSVKNCMTLVNDVNSPYLQLYPDIGNITSLAVKQNKSPVDDLMLSKNHCIAIHIKETNPSRYGGLFYGEGHVDFKSMVSAGWDLGARLFVLEYWYTGNPLWEEDLSTARNMTENILREKIDG